MYMDIDQINIIARYNKYILIMEFVYLYICTKKFKTKCIYARKNLKICKIMLIWQKNMLSSKIYNV